ncbi:3'-5' RNA exonuclease complex component [Exophiala xenobiotica]|uniref:3'-5' RNA exonuclease complex component n=1 Tax=Lithohypha guttulata TaxID=1690604 RepID=A0ABR0KD34_9EURO|nr:3'-5' RNA exonuclease complex component [Lithohypha guttulata]KAK5317682.1 3'-5' RNA exonuclease complex component [Exophiala xenobiotica]
MFSTGIHISQVAPQLASSGGVRDYLRQWTIKYHNDQQENAPSEVTLGRKTLLPNSLFVRDTADDASAIDEDEENLQEDTELDHDDVSLTTVLLVPGDAFTMNVRGLRRQFALYLGHVGPQAQFLLADGRWYVALRSLYTAHIVHNFATEEEMATIRLHLPTKPVEVAQGEGGGLAFATAFGEVPFDVSSALLARFAFLKEEGEDFKRDHARAVEQIYQNVASETEVRQLPLHQVVRQQLGIGYDVLNDGAKIVLLDKLYDDPRLSFTFSRQRFYLVTMPKRMVRDGEEVTAWARAYQDAAARAASGKDVSQDLQSNPLTRFISKARRIITKSRKIRAPTADGQLGPTLESVLPVGGGIVRRSTGESFDENEKKIVQFLFSTYLLAPFAAAPANKRNTSIGSMILRAIGAYPKYNLNSSIGKLFLQELGCVDPWAVNQDYDAGLPLNWLGLNEPARLANEKQHAAMAQLNIPSGSKQPPFPDTMAHMRKDWGSLEVFCVDSETTRVVDDGISIEPSKEFPNHYWVHTHLAHPSAFIPFDHPLHEKPFLMGGSAYMSHASDPAYPYELTDTLSVRPDGPVLTVSTLLARDGAVKDIRVVPGIVRNVIHINSKMLEQTMGLGEPITQELIVGQNPSTESSYEAQSSRGVDTNGYNTRQMSLISTHLKTFESIQGLLIARWEARKRENPDYLTMQALRTGTPDVSVRRSNPDLNYQRIFRSEHCYGDPRIRVASRKINFDERYDDQKRKYHPIAGCMLMAAESMGAWARRRQIPAVYRHQSFRFGYNLHKLNNLGQHEGYLGVTSGESLFPSPHLMLNMAQMLPITSPLRSMHDLVNLYQTDAYLKAEAAAPTSDSLADLHVDYPRSREALLRYLHGDTGYKGVSLTSRNEQKHWVTVALFRAFHYREAQLPETLDVQVGNPAKIGKETNNIIVTLAAFGLRASLVPSEQGWERLAKFRQFLPVKLQMLDLERSTVVCVAVGPPTDTPRIKDFAYPELRPH